MICLDTNAVADFLNDAESPIAPRLDRALADGQTVAISSVVLFELWYGVSKSVTPEWNAARVDDFLSGSIEVLAFDAEDAREAGRIRASLEKRGTPIGPYDVLIGAQSRRRGAILVTANLREFRRIEGLRIENWLE